MLRAILMFTLLGTSLTASALAAAACKNDVAALDTEFQAAVAKNDAATIDRLLADDYVLINSKGSVYTKADLLKEARDGKTVYTRQDDAQQTVRIWGDTAVLTALLTAAGTDEGKPFEYHVWFSDTYVCTASGWRYSFAQVGAHVTGG